MRSSTFGWHDSSKNGKESGRMIFFFNDNCFKMVVTYLLKSVTLLHTMITGAEEDNIDIGERCAIRQTQLLGPNHFDDALFLLEI